jgi:hypothetical protein
MPDLPAVVDPDRGITETEAAEGVMLPTPLETWAPVRAGHQS